MEIKQEMTINDVLKNRLTPQQLDELDNAKDKMVFNMTQEGLPPHDIKKLLYPIDSNDKRAQYFLSQLNSIEYEKLADLTGETGVQLDYTALIPTIINKAKKNNTHVTYDDIETIRKAAMKISLSMDIEPNNLVIFMEKLADEFEKLEKNKKIYFRTHKKIDANKTKDIKNNDSFFYKNRLIFLITLILIVILVYVYRNNI